MQLQFNSKAEVARAIAIAFAITALSAPFPALAQASAEGIAQSIFGLLTGQLAKTFAAIAFVICGYLFFMGRMQAAALVSVIVGCLIIFSAEWLVNQIAG